jgi:hypothetical protein
MRRYVDLFGLLLLAVWGTGCHSYVYRVVKPVESAGVVVGDQPVSIRYEPLRYQLTRKRDRLAIRIQNPTADRIILKGEKSYVIDPAGESHPLVGSALGPGSYLNMLFPPKAPTAQVTSGTGGWAWAPGYRGGFAGSDPVFYPPTVTTYEFQTAYDWKWEKGVAQVRFSYEQEGKTFEHDFEIVRQKEE